MCLKFLKKFRLKSYKFINRFQIFFYFFENILNSNFKTSYFFININKEKFYSVKNFKLLDFFIKLIKKRIFFKKKKKKIFHNLQLSILDSFQPYLIENFKKLNQAFFLNTGENITLPIKFKFFLVNCFIKKFFKLKKKQILLKKKLLTDLNNKSFFSLYFSVLGKIFSFGKKTKWNSSLLSIFELLSFTFNYTIVFLISKIFIRLYTSVELKKVLSRKRVTFIPFFIKIKRSAFLALKWIFLAALKNINITSFKNKLYLELIQILSLNSSFALQKLEENNENSFKNRANMHYRWQKTR